MRDFLMGQWHCYWYHGRPKNTVLAQCPDTSTQFNFYCLTGFGTSTLVSGVGSRLLEAFFTSNKLVFWVRYRLSANPPHNLADPVGSNLCVLVAQTVSWLQQDWLFGKGNCSGHTHTGTATTVTVVTAVQRRELFLTHQTQSGQKTRSSKPPGTQ